MSVALCRMKTPRSGVAFVVVALIIAKVSLAVWTMVTGTRPGRTPPTTDVCSGGPLRGAILWRYQMNCDYCLQPLAVERAEIYSHCPSDNCVTMWRRERLQGYALTLVPKSGFQIVERSDEFLRVGGRSSGRV